MVDYESLKDIIDLSVRFLDNTIEMSRYPLPEITAMVQGNRKIGLGIMGFADLLYQLNIPYNSETALETAESVMQFIQETAHDASRNLAEERGVFKNYDKSIFKDQGVKYRNATTTTIAPTGTLSIIAGCSSGIEPLFALSFVRNVMDNDKLLEVNPVFEKVAREGGFFSRELMDEIARQGSVQNITEIPEDVRKVFVTAHDVSPEWHIRMQAAFQKHTDNAVSKTVNLPHDATLDDVKKVYDLAYDLGCKGVTIYRDGSKENQVLSFARKEEKAESPFMTAVKERPETLPGYTTKIKTGYGYLYITVTEFEGRPFEVFATIGKSGRSTTAKTEAIGRLVSLALRSGVKVDKIVNQLKGIGGEYPIFQNGGLVLSIPDAIARVLEQKYMTGENAPRSHKTEFSLMGEKCPECGQTVSFEEGCMMCHFCGFNKCG
jgi:ribonucleoside-diphosphate reductase alpha chain